MKRIGFGGGCHWCTEAVFQALCGVTGVAQGFVRSMPPHDSWSEAVVVRYDPEDIALKILIAVHLHTHASTVRHRLRGKYRSAVYIFDDAQRRQAEAALRDLQAEFDAPLQTLVLRHEGFRLSEARFRDYYATDPQRPFCRTHIEPKLRLLRARYPDGVRARLDNRERLRDAVT